jgi:hypothetical protein
MQYAVMYQAERRKGQLRPGDLLVSNTPEAGGGHLPDITVSGMASSRYSATQLTFAGHPARF